jgi:inner membrane protein
VATALAHAALPAIAEKALGIPPVLRRRLVWVAIGCACWPDLDVIGYAVGVRETDLLGHRGITHSLFAALLVSALAALLWFRQLRVGSRAFLAAFGFLFLAAASHGLIDAMTSGAVGVALLAPFSARRFLFPFKLIPSCPLGVDELFGFWGLMTLANELLYVLIPVSLGVSFWLTLRSQVGDRRAARMRVLRSSAVWLATVLLLRNVFPEYFVPLAPRVLRAAGSPEAGDPEQIAHDDLPDGKLVTRLDALRGLGLFDRELTPNVSAWSSSFFPAWYGAEAGRWTDGTSALIWRTLFGFAPPKEKEARAWLASAAAGDAAAEARLFTLAPTEKLDLANGELAFPATVQALERTHNGHPRFWSGRCNGVAAAALYQPEPFRVVEVIGKEGQRVRFHPNDVKALLAVAYARTRFEVAVGLTCSTVSFDAPSHCSMDPAVFVIALLNRIGVARQSFLIDALPTRAKQYYAVASARVRLLGSPHAVGGLPTDPALAGHIASVVDVGIDLELSSTTLSYAPANVLDPAFSDGTHYERVGLRPVPMSYRATLALGEDSELLGGRWEGDPADGPDDAYLVSGGPALDEAGNIADSDAIYWPFVRELARASVDEREPVPTVDLRTQCDGRCAR